MDKSKQKCKKSLPEEKFNAEKNPSWCNRLKSKANVITNLFAILGVVLTMISVVQWFIPNDSETRTANAMRHYESGLTVFEDGELLEAKEDFRKAYEINNNLLDVKYYYAYTEYLLGNLDKSYKILQRNKTSLNDDELAFYAMYEFDKGNYDVSEIFLNKIREPEKLRVASLTKYVITSLKIASIHGYNDAVNAFYINTVLLNTKLEEIHPRVEIDLYENDEIKIDKDTIDKTINRINNKDAYDTVALMRCKLSMFMLFAITSIECGQEQIPIHFFSNTAECFDYFNNHGMSMQFLVTLYLYTVKVPYDAFFSERIETTYEIIMDKYYDILSEEERTGVEIIREEDRVGFELCEQIFKDFKANTFNPNNYGFEYSVGGIYDDYKTSTILDLWCDVIQDNYYE